MRPWCHRSTPCRPRNALGGSRCWSIGILAPLGEAGLAATFGLLSRGAPGLGGWRQTVAALLTSGELESGEVDGDAVLLARRWHRTARLTASSAAACAVRPDRLGTPPVRASLGLGLPVRGLHQAGAAPVRLLRDAAAVGLRRHRLGQCQSRRRANGGDTRLRWRHGPETSAFRRGLDAELAAMESFLA